MNPLSRILIRTGAVRHFHRLLVPIFRQRAMLFPTFDARVHAAMLGYADYQRGASIGLALESLRKEEIPGCLAEVGVFKGEMSRFIHGILPERTFYLFDTFSGFSTRDSEGPEKEDTRFRDTDVESVLRTIGDRRNIVVRPGWIPETLRGLEHETFAFVLLDLDKYQPTLAALEFFYPRIPRGGYLFVHDFNSQESNAACKRALTLFLRDRPELPIELADKWGSAVVRRI